METILEIWCCGGIILLTKDLVEDLSELVRSITRILLAEYNDGIIEINTYGCWRWKTVKC
jgi:hypothetical protein